MLIGTLMASLGVDTKPLYRNLNRATRMFKNFSRKVAVPLRFVRNSITRLRSAFLGLKTMIAGTIAIMATRAFLKFGMNFERTMSIVQVVSQATGKEMDSFRKQVKELGITTEFTATQAGEALKFLAMAGLSVTQAMEALPHTLDLATAGQIDLARAADISTNIMSQMSLRAKDLTMVNDALVAVQATANTNIEEASQAFVYAGAKARVFGMNVAELAAMIGLLANNGIKATMAGTTLRQAMIKMIKPTSDGAKIMKKYDLQVQNADGTLRDFTTVIKEMADANLNALEVVTMFGARAANIELILKLGSRAIDQYVRKVETMTGVSKTAADVLRSDVMGRFNELKSALQGVLLEMWDVYKEKIKNAMIGATKWVREHSDEIIKKIRQTEQFIKDIVFEPGFAAALIPEISGALFDGLVAGMQAFLSLKVAMWDVFLDPLVNIMLAKFKLVSQSMPKQMLEWTKEKGLRALQWSKERDVEKFKQRVVTATEKYGPGSAQVIREQERVRREEGHAEEARKRVEDFQKRSAQKMADYIRQLRKEYDWNMRDAMELDPAAIERAGKTFKEARPKYIDPVIKKTKERFKGFVKEPSRIPSFVESTMLKEQAAEKANLADAINRVNKMVSPEALRQKTDLPEYKRISNERRIIRELKMIDRMGKEVGRHGEELATLIEREKELGVARKDQAALAEKIAKETARYDEFVKFEDRRQYESERRIAEMKKIEDARGARIGELKQEIDNSVKVEINVENFSGTEDNLQELEDVATAVVDKALIERDKQEARNSASILQSQGV